MAMVQPESRLKETVLPANVAVPVRAGPSFGWTSSWTVPLPDRLPGPGIPSQGALLTAVHEHSAGVVTVTFCDPPAAAAPSVSGATPALHPESCVTVNVCPPAVIVPLRATPVLAATVNCTCPLPVPLAPDVMASHAALLLAVQAHPAPAVTVNDPDAPPDGTVWPAGASENEHPPLCVSVNVWPPAMIVPVRCGPGLAAARYRTVPFPLPLVPAVIVSHDASLAAVHAHPAAVRTSNVASPPPAGAVADEEDSDVVQSAPWLTVNVRPAIVSVPDRAGPLVAATL
jgi:hypothetical protein